MRGAVAGRQLRLRLVPPRNAPLEERFWARVDKNGPKQPHMKTRCWVWVGQINRSRGGYGVFNGHRVPEWAHRAAWQFKHGSIPKNLFVLHKCDHPPCVRHLFLGTHSDNMRDARLKNRTMHGERNRTAKLNRRDVIRVRTLLHKGWTQQAIADTLKVVQRQAISDIARGVTWWRVR
jgi:hypothetical protein